MFRGIIKDNLVNLSFKEIGHGGEGSKTFSLEKSLNATREYKFI